MDRPFCLKCGKNMYMVGIHLDTSAGLQTTQYRCFSLNNRHDTYQTEPIPGWESKAREEKILPTGRRMTPRTRRRVLSMLAKKIPYSKIAQKVGFSVPRIYQIKASTLLAVAGVALRGLK